MLVGSSPPSSHAQGVRGRLVDARGGAGIGGAMVTLVDRDGNDTRRTLTRSTGLFQLMAPSPGRYRPRADRIGYAATLSEDFVVPPREVVQVDIVASMEAISLAGIEATGDPRCRIRPADGLAVARVWEEARKALAASEWTHESGYYYYEMMDIERTLDRDGRKVLSEKRSLSRSFLLAPYVSRPADSLVAEGFASIEPDRSLYWAPDAEALLSEPFLDTHCFRLRTNVHHAPGLIGLAFEPVSWRPVPDVGGTLWLDAATARLKRLDFTYRHLDLPETILTSGIGGTVEFEAMPNGTWIVRSWRIRMPLARMGTSRLTGKPVAFLEGIEVEGGEVIRAHENDAVLARTLSGASRARRWLEPRSGHQLDLFSPEDEERWQQLDTALRTKDPELLEAEGGFMAVVRAHGALMRKRRPAHSLPIAAFSTRVASRVAGDGYGP